jgi:hypothetical protein
MKSAPRASWITASTAFLALTSLAQAHPGHDGGHDLTWDFGHLAQHPVATLVWTTLIGAAVWSSWQLVANREQRRAMRNDEKRPRNLRRDR